MPPVMSVIVIPPEEFPTAVGTKAMPEPQFAPGPSDNPTIQDPSLTNGPVIEMPVIVVANVPLLKSEEFCSFVRLLGEPTNDSELGVNDKFDTPPTPVRGNVWGLFDAVSITLKVSVMVPAACGVNLI